MVPNNFLFNRCQPVRELILELLSGLSTILILIKSVYPKLESSFVANTSMQVFKQYVKLICSLLYKCVGIVKNWHKCSIIWTITSITAIIYKNLAVYLHCMLLTWWSSNLLTRQSLSAASNIAEVRSSWAGLCNTVKKRNSLCSGDHMKLSIIYIAPFFYSHEMSAYVGFYTSVPQYCVRCQLCIVCVWGGGFRNISQISNQCIEYAFTLLNLLLVGRNL